MPNLELLPNTWENEFTLWESKIARVEEKAAIQPSCYHGFSYSSYMTVKWSDRFPLPVVNTTANRQFENLMNFSTINEQILPLQILRSHLTACVRCKNNSNHEHSGLRRVCGFPHRDDRNPPELACSYRFSAACFVFVCSDLFVLVDTKLKYINGNKMLHI